MICRFLKGAFHKYPPSRVVIPAWDLDIVLEGLQRESFAPLQDSALRHCTLKTVFLVAITSAKRCSEIQVMGRADTYLRFEAGGVRVRHVSGFLPKTATPFHLGQDIFLPEFREASNKKLCVKRDLEHYIMKTNSLVQEGEQHLFVSFGGKKPGLTVSQRTVSGWFVRTIKETYQLMGADAPSTDQAHSTRAMATSWVMFNGAFIMDVMKAADWRSSQTFARHYGLDLWKRADGLFGRAVLNQDAD